MANTFELIASSTVGAGGASAITFSSIPSTYTDLCLKMSLRLVADGDYGTMTINGSGSNFSSRRIYGDGSAATSATRSDNYLIGVYNASGSTGNTFANLEIYFPNYAGSNNKSFSIDAVTENNATSAVATLSANLWSNTPAINALSFLPYTSNFAQFSTAYLYGVKNA